MMAEGRSSGEGTPILSGYSSPRLWLMILASALVLVGGILIASDDGGLKGGLMGWFMIASSAILGALAVATLRKR